MNIEEGGDDDGVAAAAAAVVVESLSSLSSSSGFAALIFQYITRAKASMASSTHFPDLADAVQQQQ